MTASPTHGAESLACPVVTAPGRTRAGRRAERLTILGLLVVFLAVAVPYYVAFRERANDVTAIANVQAITPSIYAYFGDHGTYRGMTLDGLRQSYDPGLPAVGYSLGRGSNLTASSFCVQFTSGARVWSRTGPAGPVSHAACP